MSNTVLRIVVVIDAVALAMYGVGVWLDPDGSSFLAIATIAAMVLQIILVLRNPKKTKQGASGQHLQNNTNP